MDAAAGEARHLPPGAGQTYRVLGNTIAIKAVTSDNGGAYALFEVSTPPHKRTPSHLQRYEDETYYILEGTYTFLLDRRTVEISAGGFAFVPRGTVHSFANQSDAPARLLLLVTPGDIYTQFIMTIGESPDAPPGDPSDTWRYGMIAAKYGLELHPPPP